MSDLDELEELAKMVQSMALCGLGKSAPLPVLSTMKRFREEYEEHIGTRSAGQRSAQHSVSSTLIRNSVSAAENVPRTVLPGQFPARLNHLIIL